MAHRHGDAAWSGVYYVEAGDAGQGGEITFAAGQRSCAIVPRAGLMMVFPGSLLHSGWIGSRHRLLDLRLHCCVTLHETPELRR